MCQYIELRQYLLTVLKGDRLEDTRLAARSSTEAVTRAKIKWPGVQVLCVIDDEEFTELLNMGAGTDVPF